MAVTITPPRFASAAEPASDVWAGWRRPLVSIGGTKARILLLAAATFCALC